MNMEENQIDKIKSGPEFETTLYSLTLNPCASSLVSAELVSQFILS